MTKNVITSAEVKNDAKKALSGQWGIAIIAVLIVLILTGIADGIDSCLNFKYTMEHGGIEKLYENISVALNSGDNLLFSAINNGYKTPTWLQAFSLIELFLTIPLSVGLAVFFVRMNRGCRVELENLFSKYKICIKCVLLFVYRYVLLFIQFIFFVIPGVVAYYSYAMSDYILVDDEDISIPDAIRVSKEMMYGHRMELFITQLSFLGWMLLSICTFGLAYIIYVGPYYQASIAAFYDRVKADYEGAVTENK